MSWFPEEEIWECGACRLEVPPEYIWRMLLFQGLWRLRYGACQERPLHWDDPPLLGRRLRV